MMATPSRALRCVAWVMTGTAASLIARLRSAVLPMWIGARMMIIEVIAQTYGCRKYGWK